METEAFRHLSMVPSDFYELTPRQFGNLMSGRAKQVEDSIHMMAIHAIMHRKAANKKTLKFSDLVGDPKADKTKRGTLMLKKDSMEDLEKSLGIPVL